MGGGGGQGSVSVCVVVHGVLLHCTGCHCTSRCPPAGRSQRQAQPFVCCAAQRSAKGTCAAQRSAKGTCAAQHSAKGTCAAQHSAKGTCAAGVLHHAKQRQGIHMSVRSSSPKHPASAAILPQAPACSTHGAAMVQPTWCSCGAAYMVQLWCSLHAAAMVQPTCCSYGAAYMLQLWCSLHGPPPTPPCTSAQRPAPRTAYMAQPT